MIRRTILPPTFHNQNAENLGQYLIFTLCDTRLNFFLSSGFIYYKEVNVANTMRLNRHRIITNGERLQEKDYFEQGKQQSAHRNSVLNGTGGVAPGSGNHLMAEVAHVGRA